LNFAQAQAFDRFEHAQTVQAGLNIDANRVFGKTAIENSIARSMTGGEVAVQFGRIGTKVQAVIKRYDSHEKAMQEADKLILEKTRKGYPEHG
jgi:predicted DNA-binding WGR domain protein